MAKIAAATRTATESAKRNQFYDYVFLCILVITLLMIVMKEFSNVFFVQAFVPQATHRRGISKTTHQPSLGNTFVEQQAFVTGSSRRRTRTGTSSTSLLHVGVVDREEVNQDQHANRKGGDMNVNHDSSYSGSWIPTASGGYLPNLSSMNNIGRETYKDSGSLQRASSRFFNKQPTRKIYTARTLQEYKKLVMDEQERIVCVKFFASWCKACKAIEPHFAKLMKDTDPSLVKFVQVPLEASSTNASLHVGLGVTSLPYGHIYVNGMLAEECKIGRKRFADYANKLQTYLDGSCPVDWDQPQDQTGKENIYRLFV